VRKDASKRREPVDLLDPRTELHVDRVLLSLLLRRKGGDPDDEDPSAGEAVHVAPAFQPESRPNLGAVARAPQDIASQAFY
jgi:hypothetical protein